MTRYSKFGERSEQQIWETSRKWDKFRFLWVELYVGTAHSQKAKSAKITLNTTFKVIFYKCYFSYQYGKSESAIRQTLLSLRDISPVRGISLALRYVERNSVFEWISLKFIINTSFLSPFPHQIFNLSGTPNGISFYSTARFSHFIDSLNGLERNVQAHFL